MPTAPPTLILLLVIGAVCALIGKTVQGSPRGGIVVSILLGFVGALLGPWVAMTYKLPRPMNVDVGGHPFSIIWAVMGAALFVAILHLFSDRYGGYRIPTKRP